ncbi:MAG TPA: glycosyltransferase family 4 protein, partial [Bacteroidales bacterium]|nr:glycosyltransferase family 4 protein [Bacteroidales bacterium]
MQVFSLADLFVMPNIHVEGDEEGFGLVALEASIRGTYVLASNMEGITEAVIDGKNGSLMPSEDAEAWANKIEKLLSDKPKLEAMAKEGQKFTDENFCWNKMVLGYKAVFDKTIHSPKE